MKVRRLFSERSKLLEKKTTMYRNRAVIRIDEVISAIPDQKHQLMARLQIEAGCRCEGVGASRRGRTEFSKVNFCDPDSCEDLGVVVDPASGLEVAKLWTIEKGGKMAWKFCLTQLKKDLLEHFGSDHALSEDYSTYLNSINTALSLTGQEAPGKGTHGLRFAFARRRYAQCLAAGFSEEGAKQRVSHEMSHNRPDITEIYLK